MPKMHIRQLEFTYSACRPFAKNKWRIQKLKETRDSRHIYLNKTERAFFQHNMTNGDFKDLPQRTASDKVLC